MCAQFSGVVRLRSARSGHYLHVKAEESKNGDPVYQCSSASEGSQWFVEKRSQVVILKSLKADSMLHVAAQNAKSGDPVCHYNSGSEGSQWSIEQRDQLVMLKNVRSGCFLHVAAQHTGDGDPVFHFSSTSEGSQWLVEQGSAEETITAQDFLKQRAVNKLKAAEQAQLALQADEAELIMQGKLPNDTDASAQRAIQELFKTLDKDCDQMITKMEWSSFFRMLDTNKHGSISREDWRLARGETYIFDLMDKKVFPSLDSFVSDNAGSLTETEWLRKFDAIDLNKDAKISMTELLCMPHSSFFASFMTDDWERRPRIERPCFYDQDTSLIKIPNGAGRNKIVYGPPVVSGKHCFKVLAGPKLWMFGVATLDWAYASNDPRFEGGFLYETDGTRNACAYYCFEKEYHLHKLQGKIKSQFGKDLSLAGVMESIRLSRLIYDSTWRTTMRTSSVSAVQQILQVKAVKRDPETRQPFAKKFPLEQLLSAAEAAQKEISTFLAGLGLGELHDPGVKSLDSARRKAEDKYNGEATYLLDVSRMSIIFATLDELVESLQALLMKFPSVIDVDNRFAKPTPLGYRDINILIKSQSGFIVEVQMHIKDIKAAKDKAHLYYEEIRALLGKEFDPKTSNKVQETIFDVISEPNSWICGQRFGKNDELEVELDIDNQTVSFFVNGSKAHSGFAFTSIAPGAEYYPAIVTGCRSGLTQVENYWVAKMVQPIL